MASLPPKVPTTLAALDRLVMLLGNRSKGPLNPKPKKELEELCGVYPDPLTATHWKTELKEIRKELLAEESQRQATGQPEDDEA
jgi:hypothetical protein